MRLTVRFIFASLFPQRDGNASHDVIGTGQRDRIAERPVTVHWWYQLTVFTVLCPVVRQAHEPFALNFRWETDAAARRIIRVPEGKGRDITG